MRAPSGSGRDEVAHLGPFAGLVADLDGQRGAREPGPDRGGGVGAGGAVGQLAARCRRGGSR